MLAGRLVQRTGDQLPGTDDRQSWEAEDLAQDAFVRAYLALRSSILNTSSPPGCSRLRPTVLNYLKGRKRLVHVTIIRMKTGNLCG